MNDDSNKKRLYDALSKDYELGTFEQFSTDVEDEGKRRKLYDAIINDYDLPDFKGFTEQLIGPAKSQHPAGATPNAAVKKSAGGSGTATHYQHPQGEHPIYDYNGKQQTTGEREEKNEKPTGPAQFARQMAFEQKVRSTIPSPEELQGSFSERMEKIRNGNEPFSSNSEMRLNPESGKMERVYFTRDGQEVATPMEQSQINHSINQQTQTRKDLANLDGNIYAMLEDAASMFTDRVVNDEDVQTLTDKNAGFFKRVGAAIRFNTNYGGGASGRAVKSYTATPEVRELRAAQRKVRDAKRIVAEADNNARAGSFGKWLEQSFAGGAVRGFGQNATDLDNWDFGFTDIMDNQALMSALNAADKGEQLTPSQQALLDATVMEMAVDTYFGSEVGRGYKAGSVTAESLPFMLEMVINPASGFGSSGAAKMTRYALRRFGKASVKKGGSKYATRKALEIGGRVAGDVLGSATMTASTGAVRTTADAIDRMNQAQMNGEELDAGKAFAEGFANTTIENYSEMFGAYFMPLMKAAGGGLTRIATSKIGSTVGLDRVRSFIDNVAASEVAQVITDFEKHSKWNGVFGEYAEEVVGGVMNSIIVGDQTLDTNHDTGVFNLDNNIDTFLGVSLLGGFMSAVKTVGYRSPKYRAGKDLEAAGKTALSVFACEEGTWERIRQALDAGTVAEVKTILQDINTNEGYTPEQRAALLDYANKATAYKGVMMAEQKRRTEGSEENEAQIAAEEAYDRGYDSDESSRRDIAMEFADVTLGSMSQEERKAAWEGVQAKIQDDADNMVEGMREDGSKKQHSDGTFRPATLKEKDENVVYIVKGNVQMMSDGTMVDPNTSDKSVAVFDPATGERRMIDPSSDMGILSLNDVTTEEEYESDIARIRDEFVKSAFDEAQGTVRVELGQQLTTPSGKQGKVTAVSPDGESFIVTAEDGEEVSMERGELQKVADAAALAEYQSRHESQAPVEEEKEELPQGVVEGAPDEFTPGMEITIRDEDGNEQSAKVIGRVRLENFGYVPDDEGKIIEYIVGKKAKHDYVDQFTENVVSHVAPVAEETADESAPIETQQLESEPQTAVETVETPVEGETHPEGSSLEPMPMREDGEADFMATTPDRGHKFIYDEAGLSREEAGQFVNANIEAAEKTFNKLKGKSPKMGTSISRYQQEKAALQEQIDNAWRVVDYWHGVKSVQDTILAQEAAERAERDRLAHEASVVAEQARQAEEIAKQQEQEQRGANAVHPAIREKWESAPKVEGVENEITLANGETVKGRYMLVESGAATPSHNPNMEFARNEGFPVDENGQTVNDRDYERDREAQTITRQMGDTYDSRAIQSVPVVSNDGVVLSGNGRTMAGELAAQNGTDGAYIERLKKYPQQFGFTAEQVEGMQHPRVVFVANENMPYTTETFAKFNQQDMKSQSRTEQAVKLGKTVDNNTFGRIVRSINSFDTLGDFYNDPVAAVSAIRELHQAGAINTMQMAEMMDGEKISGQGRQILENMLIGKAFESNPDAIRQLSEFPAMRQSVVSALAEVANNIKLGEEYSLTDELSEAINLAYQARKSGIKAGDRVSWYARQMNLFTFEEGESVADYNNGIVLMLADIINDSRVNQLKKTLALYNDNAAMSAAGQYDIFSGGIKSKEDIIKDVLNTLKYGTETEQQQALAWATERRKESVQEDGTAATGSGESEGAAGSGENEDSDEPKPIGRGAFGYIYDQFKGKVKEAFAHLLSNRNGDCLGVFHREDVGEIDLVWGDEKAGLSHIIGKHVGEGKSFANVDEMMSALSDIINNGEKTFDNGDKVVFKIGNKLVSIRKNYREYGKKKADKNWVLTAYDETSADSGSPVATIESQAGTATDVSSSKDTNISEIDKIKVASAIESAEKETKTEPTDGQKKARNYKIGHVTVDGYDISIENPKGSVKTEAGQNDGGFFQDRVVDEECSETLRRALADAYARGNKAAIQKAVDGLRKYMDEGGDFTTEYSEEVEDYEGSDPQMLADRYITHALHDMHTDDDADQEYIKTGVRSVTPVTDVAGTAAEESLSSRIEVLNDEESEEGGPNGVVYHCPILIDGKCKAEKIDEPDEKGNYTGSYFMYEGKRYSDLMEVVEQIDNSDELSNAEASITPTQYTTKRGKVLDLQLVKFAEELTKEQQKAARELAKGMKGWWSSQDGGYLMRSAEDAQRLVDAMSSKEAVTDAHPLTLTDMATVSDVAQQTKEETAPEEVKTKEQQAPTTKEGKSDAAPKSKWVDEEDAERFEELRRRLRASRGQLNMGVNPEEFAIGVEMSFMVIKHGARKFGEYAKQMIDALGEWVRPYLKAFYNGARDLPESEDYEQEMTPYDEVRSFDVQNFDKEGPKDIIATAEQVVKETEAEEQADIASGKLKETRNTKRKETEGRAKKSNKTSKTAEQQSQFSLFGEETISESVNKEDKNNNNHERTNVQPGTAQAGRGRQQLEQNEPMGGSARDEVKRTDSRGVGGRDKQDSSADGAGSRRVSGVPSGNGRTVSREDSNQPKRNLNNNHAERGTDYAPKDVDRRIEANISAIEKMQELMESGRQATKEEMSVLRKFSGWGGLGKAFSDVSSPNAKAPSTRLRELLGDEGYEQANMSRNSAYYTPAKVIDTMWDIARMMGFKGGKVLEGSAGIGNIIGAMPADISEHSDIHAVEIDITTGNILKLLYPDAKVDVQGFEATQVENCSVDLAITNVPFVTGLRVSDNTGDQDLSKKFHDIHDFCIAKNIRKLREGGIGIFITSSGTLDNSARLREWIIQEGNTDVVGAFRLNNDTFGGTGATSDIIVVRKHVNGQKSANAIDVLTTTGERTAEFDTGETKKVKGEYVSVVKQLSMDYNRYFVEHPENMGGEMKFGFEQGDNYRPTSKALYPIKGKNQAELLYAWVRSFEGKEWDTPAVKAESETNSVVYAELGEDVKEGSIVVSDGQLCIAQRGQAVPLGVNANKVKGHTKVECFNHYKSIKDALDAVLRYQTENETDEGLQPLINELNRAYDTFIKTYGHLHKNTTISFLKSDVDFANILALEKFSERIDAKSGARNAEYGKTDIFSRRVVEKEKDPEPTNVKDGIIASIYVHGRVDIPWIAESMSKHSGQQVTDQQVKEEIINAGLGFEDTATRQVEVNYEYLSGNVREKLQQAIDANTDGRYNANIKALEDVIPMNIPAHLIDFSIGSSWIDPSLYEEYVKDRTDISVTCTAAGGTWYMKKPYFEGEQKNRAFGIVSQMLHKTIMGTDLIEAAMTNKSITVSETKRRWDGSTETIVDKDATTACANKIDEIRADFKDWARAKMQSDTEKSARIERIYNDMFNNYVPRDIPDDFVPEHFGEAATVIDGRPFALRPHQGKAVVRATTQPLLLAHEVGTGKTYTLITTAMEMRRLGTAKKPMIVVQNATVGQFVESAKKLYPNAKVLTIEDKEHTADGRKNFYAKIKYNDWDMIVVPQSVFERIPDSPEREMAYIKSKIEEKMLVLEEMRDADPNGQSMIVKAAERELEKLQNELSETTEKISGKRKERDAKKEAVTRQNAEVKAKEMLDRQTDDVENFDDMGIDALLVDEAHEYKHLGFATAMQRGVKGVDPSYSKKAQGVFLKTQAVMERNNGRNVVFATGTPISNTAAEIWTFMRYLMPVDTMKEYGLYYFDDFVRNFGNLTQMLEFTTSGKFKENNRFAGYVNLPELVRIWSGVADTVLTKEAGGVSDKIPAMEGGKAQDIYLPQTKALRSVMKFVKAELDKYDKMTGKEKKEHSHIPLTMYGIAKAAAVDARLVVADAVDEEQSKTNEAMRQTLKSLEDTKEYKGTVAIFADNYQNKRTGFNLYEVIRAKLEAAGVPPEQIVVMKSGMTVKKKLEIFDMVNRGDVRVIMGSTFTLGTGVNIQERLHTIIHLDAPNRPMDYTQRNGRILRQGNLHKEMNIPVRVLRFGVEDSLDVTAYQRLKTKGAIADSIMNGKQMMNNSMENRVLEEEEDVFGDTVAQLSGSEYAMLKNQAEKDVRKYENKKKQWEADQTYCHNEIPRLEGVIRSNSEMRLESLNKTLVKVEEMAKKQTSLTIAVEKQKFSSIEAMADYIKEFNKKVRENESAMREDPYRDTERKLTLKFNIGGFDFTFTTDMSVETTSSQGTLFSAIHRKMTYDCPALELEAIPVHQSLLREGLEDIVNNVITGKDFRERIERIEKSVEKNKKELAQVKERAGKPFGYADELAAAHKHYDEYAELMKQELEEKEKKYADMDANVEEATGVVEAAEDEEDAEDDEDVLFRTSEELDAEYPDWMSRQQTSKGGHSTQITGTVSTYRKIGEHLIDEFGEEASRLTILDASSGKGVGTKAMRDMGLNVEDVEPYPASDREQQPTYTKYSDIDKQYDIVVSNAVLNVIPDDWRADLLWQMSRLVKPGGRMIINTRGLNDAKTIKHKTVLDDESEVLTSTSYQKFFSHETLKDFIEETLGEGWSIENATKSNAGFGNDNAVVVTRLSDGETTLNREGDGHVRPKRSYEESLAASRRAGYSKRQHDAMLVRDERRARKQIADFIEKFGLTDRVEVRDDAEGFTEHRAKARGWYNPSNGKIVIILGNHHSKEDVMKTILHEGVGHYGLRALFGTHFDTFLDNVYLNADGQVRGQIIELAKKHGWNFHTATEEYLSRLAEDTNFNMETSIYQGWWSKIKELFWEMLYKIGMNVQIFRGTLSDNELRYLLWRSYKNLTEPGRYRSLVEEAEDVVMQNNLKVGEFEEERQPLAIEEREATEVAENKLLFRDEDFTERDRVIARDHYERMVASGGYQFKEAMQDSMLGLRKAMEAIDGGKHFRVENVPGNENAYLAENRMSSVNAAEQTAYFREYMQPLLKAVHGIAGDNEAVRKDLVGYMMAKHGLERNIKFAERDAQEAARKGADYNTELQKNRNKDYSGLTALTGNAYNASAEVVAQRMVDEFESLYDVSQLWEKVNEATKTTLAKVYQSGMLSEESYAQIRDMFDFYIPLRGWDETTSDEVYGYLTSKDGPLRGSTIKHAYGRSSKADDPIATIGLMADTAIRQGNRNEMKQRFLTFVQNHPSDLVSVSKLWLQYDAASDEWMPVFADIKPEDTAYDVERKVKAFEQRMEQLAAAEPDKYKTGSKAANIPYKVVKGNISEHQVLVKRGGETFVLTINGNPRAAQALNGLTNPDVETNGVIGNMLKLAEYTNRQMSSFYTTRTPDFIVSNFFRDMLYSNCMAWVKENPRYALTFHKNFGKVNPAMMRRLFGKWENGTLDGSNEIERQLNTFMMNGGETGYTSVKDIEGHKKAIASELRRQGSAARKVWHSLGMQLDLLNRSVENCARFAAFMTSQEFGRSVERSIYDAKEVSINFNKKGSGGKMVNAKGQTFMGKAGSYMSGAGRLFYVFWNAGVQGMTNFGRAAKRHPGKFAAGSATMFTLGAIIPLLAKAIGGDDDDDKNAYYNLPEYVRRSNICYRVGEQWVTIPLPIEFRAIYGLGELATGVIGGYEHYSDGELAKQLTSQVSQVLPLDFMEGGGGLHPFIPSVAKPIVEARNNKSWTGLPIYRDNPWNQTDPEFTKVYKNADKHIVAASKWLNESTGGDDYKKGWADVVNPAQVEYVLNGYLGGYFKVPNQLVKMTETTTGDREFEWRNMMIANRLVKSGDERTAYRKLQNEYFKYEKEYKETKRLKKKYENAAKKGVIGYAEKVNFLNNTDEYAHYEIFERYKKQIDNLYKRMKDEPDEEILKAIALDYYQVMREMVEAMHEYDASK